MSEDLLLFLRTRIKKMPVCKTTFVSEHLNADQSQFPTCFASVAQPVAFLTIPANSAARANHVKSAEQSTLRCSSKHAHIYINTNAKMCLKALC